jgi:exodeoxyribonuclease VII small subunit
MSDPVQPPDFEKALHELETLVDRMEKGEQSLEEALADFERGVTLVRTCQKGLDAAEQRVQRLVDEGGEARIEDLEPSDEG